MATTRYVTGDTSGVVAVVARAVDPDGNVINEQYTITINPLPQVPRCYTSVLALSTTQDSIESACSQFGVANTYYLGNPRNTVYSTDSCSNIAPDGFYKTEDGNWVNLSGGVIRQRGACSQVAVEGPRRIDTGIDAVRATLQEARTQLPIPTRSQIETVRERFVEQPTFTPPSPSTRPPKPAATPEQVLTRVQQVIPQVPEQQPVLTQTQTFVDLNAIQTQLTNALSSTPTNTFINVPPTFTRAQRQAPQPVFGCTDPSAINYNPAATTDDGSCQYQAVGENNFGFDNNGQF